MANGWIRSGFGRFAVLALGAGLMGAGEVRAQAPAKTKLKKVLLLEKNQVNTHVESRRDLKAALSALATEKGFTVTTIGQTDPASKYATEFSAASLATYQAVIFSNNDGVHAQLNATEKANLEAYVKNGGGLIPVHAASAFINGGWNWLSTALVESFFGPHGGNQPTANVIHDADGLKDGTETKGIFKGLTAPLAFLDEYYSFLTSPRGKPGVTVLLRVDEASFSKPVNGPMGTDHPVVWSKTEGKGRVVHLSMGHTWALNVYTAKNNYLQNFLYGTLRYVAGDFVGCMDPANSQYNPDATKSDPLACSGDPVVAILGGADGGPVADYLSHGYGPSDIQVSVLASGPHHVRMVDMSGREVLARRGNGPFEYALPKPSRGGLYLVVVKAGDKELRHRITVL